MKKSVLLGIVALALMSLPAFAGEEKYEGDWPGHWVWDWQDVCVIKVKMVIPWYCHIKNQDDIWLEQVHCSEIGKNPAKNKDWPCFKGCRNSDVECNFNCTLGCSISSTGVIGGSWGCSVSPADIDAPGGNTTICAKLWKADLVGAPANSEQHVANITVKVKPRT
jgi:hypothetical protein